MTCGFCHPDALSAQDRVEVDAFSRFLRMVAEAPTYVVNGRERTIVSHQWLPYIDGSGGPPPLLWEGDYA